MFRIWQPRLTFIVSYSTDLPQNNMMITQSSTWIIRPLFFRLFQDRPDRVGLSVISVCESLILQYLMSIGRGLKRRGFAHRIRKGRFVATHARINFGCVILTEISGKFITLKKTSHPIRFGKVYREPRLVFPNPNSPKFGNITLRARSLNAFHAKIRRSMRSC